MYTNLIDISIVSIVYIIYNTYFIIYKLPLKLWLHFNNLITMYNNENN